MLTTDRATRANPGPTFLHPGCCGYNGYWFLFRSMFRIVLKAHGRCKLCGSRCFAVRIPWCAKSPRGTRAAKIVTPMAHSTYYMRAHWYEIVARLFGGNSARLCRVNGHTPDLGSSESTLWCRYGMVLYDTLCCRDARAGPFAATTTPLLPCNGRATKGGKEGSGLLTSTRTTAGGTLYELSSVRPRSRVTA